MTKKGATPPPPRTTATPAAQHFLLPDHTHHPATCILVYGSTHTRAVLLPRMVPVTSRTHRRALFSRVRAVFCRTRSLHKTRTHLFPPRCASSPFACAISMRVALRAYLCRLGTHARAYTCTRASAQVFALPTTCLPNHGLRVHLFAITRCTRVAPALRAYCAALLFAFCAVCLRAAGAIPHTCRCCHPFACPTA